MKKKLLPLAIAAAMVPGFAAAADVSGFADISYKVSDDAGSEGLFNANAEVDISASPADGVTVRVDADLDLAANGNTNANDVVGGVADKGTNDSGRIEQAFFAWGATEGVTVLGGVFNNPIGSEAEDAPDRAFISRGIVYSTLDSQTALVGDNVAGLAAAFAVGPATITAAYLDDIGLAQDTATPANFENSFAFVVNYAPIEGLDLELGMVTQSDKGTTNAAGTSAGDVTNFNVVYTGVQNLTVGLDYLDADALTDAQMDIWAGYSFGAASVNVRLSDDGTDTDTALNVSYKVASNLTATAELYSNDTTTAGVTTSSDSIDLRLVASF